jgi:hypothetical protein
MKTTQVTSLFILLLTLLIWTGYVSSNPAQEQEMGLVQAYERYVQDAHFARYREHLVDLGIDRFSCR